MKYFLVFSLFTFLILSSCCDKEPICNCIGSDELIKVDMECKCNSNNFQLGSFVTNCDNTQPKGKCFEKEEFSFLLTHDCACSSLTLLDSLVVTFRETDITFFADNLYNSGFSLGGISENYFREKSDGNEFRYEFSSYTNGGDPLWKFKSCEGTPPSFIGVFKGKFNPTNTMCHAKIYWQITDDKILDSCNVLLVK